MDSSRVIGSQIVAGENITLQVDNLVNVGTLKADDSIALNSSNTIQNYGGTIQAKNDIELVAKNDITNTSGIVKANNIDLTSTEGSIVNKRFSKNMDYSENGNISQRMNIGKEGLIVSNNKLTIKAKEQFQNIGSQLQANDIDIDANKVEITTLKDIKEYKGSDRHFKSTTNLTSTLNANNININSKDTTSIIGSNLIATDDINIKAKKVDIQAVNDTTYSEIKKSSKGFLSSS